MTKKLPKRGSPRDGQCSPLRQVRRSRQLAVRGAQNRLAEPIGSRATTLRPIASRAPAERQEFGVSTSRGQSLGLHRLRVAIPVHVPVQRSEVAARLREVELVHSGVVRGQRAPDVGGLFQGGVGLAPSPLPRGERET